MLAYVHDGFLALSALSVGIALYHGFAWLRCQDLRANILFSSVALVVGVYALSFRLKIDCADLDDWIFHSRLEFSLLFLLIPLFVETIAAATHSGFSRWRALALSPLLPLFFWHLALPWGVAFSDVRGLVRIEEPWGEIVWWADGTTTHLYEALLVYVMGWCLWFLRRAWVLARSGSAFSGWSLFGSLLVLFGCVGVEMGMQIFFGSFRYPLVEGSLLLLLGATSLLLSDEVMRIAVLQHELDRSRSELARLNAEMESRVASRTMELQGALSELELFACSLDDDLRMPLREIDDSARSLAEESGGSIGVDGRQNLIRVRTTVRKVSALFDDFFGLVRSRNIAPHPVEFDLSALLREVAGEMCERFPERDVSVDVQSSLFAFSDPVLLKKALRQLLSNAWRFTLETGSPKVEIFRDGSWLVVRDNGMGFDPERGGKLFRASPGGRETAASVGDGVGLAVVQRIMHRLGGDIAAEGSVGKGAEFRLRIPGIGHSRP